MSRSNTRVANARLRAPYGASFVDAPEPVDGAPRLADILYDIGTVVVALLGLATTLAAVLMVGVPG
jgi:hypothetical protein